MPIYYIVARPETVVSLVQTGRLPDDLPKWLEPKKIICFEDPASSVLTCNTSSHQIFILEVILPIPLDSKFFAPFYVEGGELGLIIRSLSQLDRIQKIFVYSQTGLKLISRLLKSDCTMPIEIKPEIYSVAKVSQDVVKVDERTSRKHGRNCEEGDEVELKPVVEGTNKRQRSC